MIIDGAFHLFFPNAQWKMLVPQIVSTFDKHNFSVSYSRKTGVLLSVLFEVICIVDWYRQYFIFIFMVR